MLARPTSIAGSSRFGSPIQPAVVRRRTVEQVNSEKREGEVDNSIAGPNASSRPSKSRWKPAPDRSRRVLAIFLKTPLPLEIIYIILNYARYFCRTYERRLETISVRAPAFAQQFVSRSNGSLLYLRSPALGQQPLQKVVFVIQHEVAFPWAEPSARANTSPCAWFEASRYRRRARRHSVPAPKLRFATALPINNEWEEVPNTREVLMIETTRGRHTLVTSLTHEDSALVRDLQPGEKLGVLVLAGRGTNVTHVVREIVIYMFCSW